MLEFRVELIAIWFHSLRRGNGGTPAAWMRLLPRENKHGLAPGYFCCWNPWDCR